MCWKNWSRPHNKCESGSLSWNSIKAWKSCFWEEDYFLIFRKFLEGVFFLVFLKSFRRGFGDWYFGERKWGEKKRRKFFVVFLGSVLVSRKIFIFFIIFFSFTLFVVKIVWKNRLVLDNVLNENVLIFILNTCIC